MADLIERQAAIDAICGTCHMRPDYLKCNKHPDKSTSTWCEEVTSLKALPSAQPEPQWIPCKTRLPEDLEEVNVTWVNHKPESYYEFAKDKPFTASAVYYKGDWYWYSSTCADILGEYGKNDIEKVDDAIEITAWKPIGEPWKGEQP